MKFFQSPEVYNGWVMYAVIKWSHESRVRTLVWKIEKIREVNKTEKKSRYYTV